MEFFSEATMQPRRIMLLEPSALSARHLFSLLGREGYELFLVDCAQDAHDLLARTDFGLILLSTSLPDGDAMAFLKALKHSSAHFSLPVILLLHDQDEAHHHRIAMKQNLYGGITKPLSVPALLQQVSNVFLPMPATGQEVQAEFSGLKLSGISNGISEQRLSMTFSSQSALYEGRAGIVSFLTNGLRRARWEAEVLRASASGVTLLLTKFVGTTDQRSFVRKQIRLPVRYRLSNDFFRLGYSVDISGSGVRLGGVVERSLEKGTKIDMGIMLGAGKKLEVQGELAHIQDHGGNPEWGIRFLALDRRQEDLLFSVVFHEAPESGPAASQAG